MRGLTLVEIMVAIGLIAVSLMLVLSLIPVGIQSAQQAEELQSAAAWSRQLLEEAPVPEEFPIPAAMAEKDFTTKLGRETFKAHRTLSADPSEPYLYRIDVETTWQGAPRPLKLSLVRYDPAGPEPP